MATGTKRGIAALFAAMLLAVPAAASAKPAQSPVKVKPSDGDYYLGYHAPDPGSAKRRGVVVTLHGGGWKGDLGAGADQVMRTYISDLQSWGYPTYNVGYQSNRESLPDTIDAVRTAYKKSHHSPICVLGGSAGAQLALIAAAVLPKEVQCVIDIGGPPNLEDPDTQLYSASVPDLAANAFGRKNLRRMSPIKRVKDILAAVLVVAPDCDYFTSLRRQQKFVGKLLHGELVVENGQPAPQPPKNLFEALLTLLRPPKPTGVETGHCKVTDSSWAGFRAAEQSFLAANLG